MRAESPQEVAWAFHQILMEVLKRLNKAAEEQHGDVEGLELIEVARSMRTFWALHVGEQRLEDAVTLLLENGLVGERPDPRYAWDRARVVGPRLVITTLGKDYLVRQLEETNRIP